MNRLILIGASGHGKVVADIAKKCGYEDIVFLDSDPSVTNCGGCSVLGPDSLLPELDGDVFVSIGNAAVRKKLSEREKDRHIPVLIHPSAVIAPDVVIGEGSVVMAGAVINPGAVVGKGVIVNTCSSIDHDCVIGDYVHVSVGAHLSGTVTVGEGTWIGAGATVSNNIDICPGCMIGAGAVVIKSIEKSGVYIGVPAKRIPEKR